MASTTFTVSLVLLCLLQMNCSLGNLKDKVASLSEDGIDLLEQERQLIDKLKEQLERSSSTIAPDTSELELLAGASASSTVSSTCHMLPSEIHVTKEHLDESGSTVRTCEGDLQVNKCDGSCTSELRPSITSPTGFATATFGWETMLQGGQCFQDGPLLVERNHLACMILYIPISFPFLLLLDERN